MATIAALFPGGWATAQAGHDDGSISLKSVLSPQTAERPAIVESSDSKSPSGQELILRLRNSAHSSTAQRSMTTPIFRLRTTEPAATEPTVTGPTTPVPPVPTAAQHTILTGPEPPALRADRLNADRPDGIWSRDILLTAGQDHAATLSIPELVPPSVSRLETPTADAANATTVPATVSNAVCQCQKCRAKRRRNRPVRSGSFGQKFKSGTQKLLGCFVEVEECDEVYFDVYDYDMPVLLVSDSVESDADQQQAKDPTGLNLLSRKLTDIQPTLNYAYGDIDESSLPKGFHENVDRGVYTPRVGPKMVLQWEPTNLWYYPLYFEDTGLERYGHTHKPWVQPFVSTGKFFGQVAMLPYKMTLDPHDCPQYSLGYYQPGEWAPKKTYQLPFNEEAAATQFLWMTGLVLLFP